MCQRLSKGCLWNQDEEKGREGREWAQREVGRCSLSVEASAYLRSPAGRTAFQNSPSLGLGGQAFVTSLDNWMWVALRRGVALGKFSLFSSVQPQRELKSKGYLLATLTGSRRRSPRFPKRITGKMRWTSIKTVQVESTVPEVRLQSRKEWHNEQKNLHRSEVLIVLRARMVEPSCERALKARVSFSM